MKLLQNGAFFITRFFRILTDNGSNMVAAFKADRRIHNVETEELDDNFSDSTESLTEIEHNINADANEELD